MSNRVYIWINNDRVLPWLGMSNRVFFYKKKLFDIVNQSKQPCSTLLIQVKTHFDIVNPGKKLFDIPNQGKNSVWHY
jgi:hypothetical protein